MMRNLNALMDACVKVGGPKPGTGYLVAANRIATCYHVVDLWSEGETHEVQIGYPKPTVRDARVIASDKLADCAILSIEPDVDTAPLPLADELTVQTLWEGYGFPHSANGVGTYMKGEVLIPQTRDEANRAIIQLFSAQAAAGDAAPLHGFSGTPVLVDGAVVGHMIRHIGDPDDRRRPAYGIIYAAPVTRVAALLDLEPARRAIHPALLVEATGFVEEMQERGATEARQLDEPRDKTLRSARILIGQNRPELALQLLEGSGQEALQAMQMRALALAKAGDTKESIALLKTLVAQGAKDHETLGLLAGRYKDLWRDTGDMAALRASYQIHRDTFEDTGDSFNGINAAATALYCGERGKSVVLANRVLECFHDTDTLDHWNLATIGEAWLLQDNFEQARDWYGKAVTKAPELYQDIAVMRRQARINLKYLDQSQNAFDKILPVPGVLAFAGHMLDEDGRVPPRFPKEKIGAVRRAVREKLQALGFVQGFGTAAKGSDIIFLEEMVRRKVKPIVIMPFPEDDFRRVSVGEQWGERLDRIRDQLEVMVLDSEAPTDDQLPQAFNMSNLRIFHLAEQHARRLDESPRLLAVWDGRPGDGPGGTADAVRLWCDEGYETIVIDINTL